MLYYPCLLYSGKDRTSLPAQEMPLFSPPPLTCYLLVSTPSQIHSVQKSLFFLNPFTGDINICISLLEFPNQGYILRDVARFVSLKVLFAEISGENTYLPVL